MGSAFFTSPLNTKGRKEAGVQSVRGLQSLPGCSGLNTELVAQEKRSLIFQKVGNNRLGKFLNELNFFH